MRQFFLPEEFKGEPEIQLRNEDFHYLTRVLRYPKGKTFPGRDREGRLYELKLTGVSADFCTVSVVRSEEIPTPEDSPDLTEIIIYPCILKGKKIDQVIRQTTETGVSRIQPVISRNTVVRLSPGDDRKKQERWQKIAVEASQQCGNPALTEISTPIELNKISIPKIETGLFFHEKMLENNTLHGYLREVPQRLHLFFGPEGGFSPEEAREFIKSGIMPVYLGTNVLRAETAVIYGTGAVQTILREHDRW